MKLIQLNILVYGLIANFNWKAHIDDIALKLIGADAKLEILLMLEF